LDSKAEDFYNKLEQRLQETSNWPSEYIFKFIIPTDQAKIDKISEIFNYTGAVIKTKTSSKGNYTSISVRLHMKSPNAVIQKYKIVGYQIEGVISL
jgi:putative lipoic acid-binding regulatory protein